MKGITETSSSAPQTSAREKTGAREQKTKKQRLQERLKKAGVKGVENMTVDQLHAELCRIKNEGKDVPDLRQNNKGAPALAKEGMIMEMKETHLMEDVEVTIHDRKTNKVLTKKRATMLAILDMLRQEALGKKNIQAAKEYLDRTLGKSKQEIEHSGEIKVEEQRLPTKAEKAAAAAYLKALDEDE